MARQKHSTKALFLAKEPRGETDLVFTLYSQDLGKIKVAGKGIRKMSSKLRSSAQVFYLSEIKFIEGRAGKILTDAIVLDKQERIFESPAKFLKTAEIAEKIDQVFIYEQQDSEVWSLLLDFFDLLGKAQDDSSEIENISADFLEKLTKIVGCGLTP